MRRIVKGVLMALAAIGLSVLIFSSGAFWAVAHSQALGDGLVDVGMALKNASERSLTYTINYGSGGSVLKGPLLEDATAKTARR